jgi:hypothetical protein
MSRRFERGPERGRHEAERDPGLSLVRAGDRRHVAAVPDRRGQLLAQAGLADARLALDHDQAPAGRARGVLGHDRLPFGGPPDEPRRLRGLRHGGRDVRLRSREGTPLVDGVVDLGRLRQRPHAELAVEHAHALPVLAQRLRPPSARRVQADQHPVRGLVQRVERQPPASVGDGVVGPAARLERRDEAVERPLQLGAQHPRSVALPVVEADAVAQAEARQEVVAVKRHRGRERLHRRRPLSGRGGQVAEPGDVHDARLGVEGHGGAGDGHPAPSERRAQGRERAPQRGPPAVGIRVGPQQVDEQLPRLRAPGHRQIGEQRHGLARVDPQRCAVHLDPRRPEHIDAKRHPAEYGRA